MPRIEGADLIHHVTGRSIPARAAFSDDLARQRFLQLLAGTVQLRGWVVLAYCLLSTHYHLLVRTVTPNLGVGMQWIHGRHAQITNMLHDTAGPLWRGRYHSSVVDTGAHVVRAAAYIDANAVDAGLCRSPEDWPWSSYRANGGLATPTNWHRPDALHSFIAADAAHAPVVYRNAVVDAIERARGRRVIERMP